MFYPDDYSQPEACPSPAPEKTAHMTPQQQVEPVPVTEDIPNLDPTLEEPSLPDVRPTSPAVTATSPVVRKSSRSTAGKTTKFDDYISTICELAKTLCKIELPQHRYLEVPEGGGEIVYILSTVIPSPPLNNSSRLYTNWHNTFAAD